MSMSGIEVRTEPMRIDAPAAFVWDILTDVENYRQWNPFTPQARTDFRIGAAVHLRVRMGPLKMPMTEIMSAFEPTRLIAWRKTFGAGWLLAAVREQHLEAKSGTSCVYRNTDRLSGVFAPIVLRCFGGFMRRGFTDAGRGLKRHAEAKYAIKRP